MKIRNHKELEEAIIELEKRKVIQHALLVHQYHQTVESLKPGNLIKRAFKSITHSPDARAGILKTVAGLGIGILTKKLFWGQSESFIKRMFGNVFKVSVAKTAISNTDKIKAYGTAIYHNLFKKKSKNTELH